MFGKLYNAFLKAFPDETKQQCQFRATEFWNKCKVQDNDKLENDECAKIKELDGCALKRKGRLFQFWGKAMESVDKSSKSQPCQQPIDPVSKSQPTEQPPVASSSNSGKRPAPAQDRIKDELHDLDVQIQYLTDRKRNDLTTDIENRKLWELRNKKDQLEKNLKAKQGQQVRQQKYRANARETKQRLLEAIPEAGKTQIFLNFTAHYIFLNFHR